MCVRLEEIHCEGKFILFWLSQSLSPAATLLLLPYGIVRVPKKKMMAMMMMTGTVCSTLPTLFISPISSFPQFSSSILFSFFKAPQYPSLLHLTPTIYGIYQNPSCPICFPSPVTMVWCPTFKIVRQSLAPVQCRRMREGKEGRN